MQRTLFCILLFILSCSPLYAITCENGYYADNETCVPCPITYPLSTPGATGIAQCYLITSPGKYVSEPMAGETECRPGDYCPGGVRVYFHRYHSVEYLQSDGNAYIALDIPFNQDTAIDLMTDFLSMTQVSFIGSRVSFNYQAFNIIIPNEGNKFRLDFGSEQYYFFNVLPGKHHLYLDKYTARVDDRTKVITNSTEIFSTPPDTTLFGFAHIPTNNTYCIESCKIYQSDELILNFIPVYDTVTKQYGMYDTVNNKFWGNDGAGDFIGGPFTDQEFDGEIGGNISCIVATGGLATRSAPGSDEITDCGHLLHIGDNVLYLRSSKRTSPALHVLINGTIYYGDMATDVKRGHLRLQIGNNIYSVFNGDVD